jgi:hypothetical protein
MQSALREKRANFAMDLSASPLFVELPRRIMQLMQIGLRGIAPRQ